VPDPTFRTTRIPSCRHCRREADTSSPEYLRAAGWRLYDGPSMTGKELHIAVCPWCAGTTDAVDPETHWRVGCSSCEWVYDPDDDDHVGDRTEPMGKAEAQRLAEDHFCSPQVWVESPRRTYATLAPNNLSLLDLVGAA
jgi:hypothetical protein